MSDEATLNQKINEANQEVKRLKEVQEKVDKGLLALKEKNDPNYERLAHERDQSRGFFNTYVLPAWETLSNFFSSSPMAGEYLPAFKFDDWPDQTSCTEHGGRVCSDHGCSKSHESAFGFAPVLLAAGPVLKSLAWLGGAAAVIYGINSFVTVSRENREREERILKDPAISNALKSKLLGGSMFGIDLPIPLIMGVAGVVGVLYLIKRK